MAAGRCSASSSLLALFFAIRGRVRIESGRSKQTVERFNGIERFGHWLIAGSFIILALTGLNMLYGRYVLAPVIGKDAFAFLTMLGKYAHNYLAFAFMVGLAVVFVLWVRHNFPDKTDLVWLSKAGGFFSKHSHPPAKKFNAGQKIIFWLVILGGVSISLSGIALLFPFQVAIFGPTFAALNAIGFSLPDPVTPMQEMQLSQIWHSIVGLFLIVVNLAHIYIGSIGMEGAFDAMGSGMVDKNWAREHHSLWGRRTRFRREARRRRRLSDRPTAGRCRAMAESHWNSRADSSTRSLGRPFAMALALCAGILLGGAPASAQRLTAESAAQGVAETYGVEVLRVREMRAEDGRRAYAVTVMAPGGDANDAFRVTTLLVDAQTGELIPQFRHTPTGHEISGAPSNVPPTEVDGPALRRRSNRPR